MKIFQTITINLITFLMVTTFGVGVYAEYNKPMDVSCENCPRSKSSVVSSQMSSSITSSIKSSVSSSSEVVIPPTQNFEPLKQELVKTGAGSGKILTKIFVGFLIGTIVLVTLDLFLTKKSKENEKK